jgi:hypothetical protein
VNRSTLNQPQYQHKVITDAGYDPRAFVGVEFQWWQNPTNKNSLRLTNIGFKWFTTIAKLKSYKITIDPTIKNKQFLQLERLFQEPYYIQSNKKIIVFSDQDAVMLQLHSGNLAAYLDSIEVSNY